MTRIHNRCIKTVNVCIPCLKRAYKTWKTYHILCSLINTHCTKSVINITDKQKECFVLHVVIYPYAKLIFHQVDGI